MHPRDERMGEKESIVRVFRFDPMRDEKPRYETFRVPFREGDRVLDLLIYIQENLDPSLAFRQSCKEQACLVCYLKANGRLILPCRERAEDNMTLEPRDRHRIVRDLVVGFK